MPSYIDPIIPQQHLANINAVVSNYPFLAGIEPETVGKTVFNLATRTTTTGVPVNTSFKFETDPGTGLMLVYASSNELHFPGYPGGPGFVSLFCVMEPINPDDEDRSKEDMYYDIGFITESGGLEIPDVNQLAMRVSITGD